MIMRQSNKSANSFLDAEGRISGIGNKVLDEFLANRTEPDVCKESSPKVCGKVDSREGGQKTSNVKDGVSNGKFLKGESFVCSNEAYTSGRKEIGVKP